VGIVLLATVVGACGGGADEANEEKGTAGANAASLEKPPPPPPMPPPSRTVARRWSKERSGIGLYPNADGVLVKPDGTEIRAWGDPRVRRYVTALFARMQFDFLEGNMAEVCRHVGRGFSLGGASVDVPCDRKLKMYAQELKDQGFEPTPLRFLWVRTYPGITGIWVEDADGQRFRVPFSQKGKGGWLLDLQMLQPSEAIAMPLRP